MAVDRSFIKALFLIVALQASCASPDLMSPDPQRVDRDLLDLVQKRLRLVPQFTGGQTDSTCVEGDGSKQQSLSPICGDPSSTNFEPIAKGVELGRQVRRIERNNGEAAESLRIRALWKLLWSTTPEDRERSLAFLRAAVDAAPSSPARLNDLAVGHLLRAGLDKRPSDLVEAIELVDRALAFRPEFREARFNRAFILQSLGLWSDARTAWEELEAKGQADSVQIRSYLEALPAHELASSDALTNRDPLALRLQGEQLLGQWARSWLEDKTEEASAQLAKAGSVARALVNATGDLLLRRAVEAIEAAHQQRTPRLQTLARGHAAFHEARGDAIYSECLPELKLAESALTAAGTPFLGWILIDRAICGYFNKDFAQSEQLLGTALAIATVDTYPALEARARWILGLLRVVQARFAEADHELEQAIKLFEHIGEDAHVTYLHATKAKNLETLGDIERAWFHRHRAVTQRATIDDQERVYTILEDTSQALAAQKRLAVAVYFLGEQMRAAEKATRKGGELDLLTYSLLDRAALQAQLGRQMQAAADLHRAEEIWASLPKHQVSRRRLRHELDVQKALRWEHQDPFEALAAVDQALSFFAGSGSLGDQIEVLKLLRKRAQINLRRNAHNEARADLDRGIAEIERQRLGADTPMDRARFLTLAHGLFEDRIRLEIDVFQNPMAALEYLERSTNRLLLDSMSDTPNILELDTPSAARNLAQAIPRGTVLIRYGHIGDRLLIWTFGGGEYDFEQRPVGAEKLAALVSAYRSALLASGSKDGLEDLGNRLTRILLPIAVNDLQQADRLLVIPAPLLTALPFAALRSSTDEPRLIEWYRLGFSPSLTLLLHPSKAPQYGPEHEELAILFVADPAFSRHLYPHLEPLYTARRAALDQTKNYRRSTLLTGQRATEKNLLGTLPEHDIFFFSGHGITDRLNPDHGGLLLAPAQSDPTSREASLLTPTDLDAHHLARLKLVVLAACSTALGVYPDSSEVAGLAAAFLAHGVPQVITAAWPIVDQHSAPLFLRFHQELADGVSAEEALRRAQLALLRSSDAQLRDPRSWAGFQLLRKGLEAKQAH